MKRMALILIACLGLLGAGCGGSDGDSSSSSEGTASTEATTSKGTTAEGTTAESTPFPKKSPPDPAKIETDKTKPKVTVPKEQAPKGLAFKDLEEGTGAPAKKGDSLTVQYVGVGYNSKSEFESTWEDKPYTFTLGAGEVLPGMEQGIEGMKAGGRRELIVPSSLAYGAEGVQPAIGPNETLLYVVDLLAVE
jgi:peptidylprolyl isomerase